MTEHNPLRLIAAILVATIPVVAVMVPLVWWLRPVPPISGLIGIGFGCIAVIAGNVWYWRWLARQR